MSIVLDGTLGITSPAETVQGALTTTGNTILGDATTDTLNVGAGGLVKDASGNVGIGTASPTTGVRADIVSDNTAQQYVNALKVSTTNTGDYHPAILFENNRSSVLNSMKLCLDSGATAGTGDFKVQTKDSGGTFNTRFIVTNAGLLQFNSGYGSAATAYGCRAWVNFNGTGTVAIRASGNVSSITDNGVGFYTVNFTTAMPDANYTAVANSAIEGTYAASSVCSSTTNTVSGAVISVTDYNGTARCDQNGIYINIFR